MKQAFAPLLEREIEKMQAWTEDQRGLAWEFAEAKRHGAEKEKADGEFAVFFAQCDANRDGLLQLEEYLAYAELYRAAREKRGEPDVPKTEAEHVEIHAAINLLNPDVEGISMTDIMAAYHHIYEVTKKAMPKQ